MRLSTVALVGALLLLGVGLSLAEPPADGDIESGKEPARVAGRVTGLDDTPRGGVEVLLTPTDYRGQRAVTTADQRGRFAFETVGPGDYRIRVRDGSRIVNAVEAAVVDGGRIVWEMAERVDPENLPIIPVGEGQFVQYDMLLASPGEAIDEGEYRGRLKRLGDLVAAGDCAAAVPGLEAYLESFPYPAKGHYLLGYCRASLGRVDEGADALRQALERNPEMPGAALLLGQVLLQSGQTEEALKWLRTEAEAEHQPGLARGAWHALAFVQRDAGKVDEAIEAFQQLRRLVPGDREAANELLALYIKAGRREPILELLDAAAEPGAIEIGPLLNLGIGDMNEKRYDDALSVLQEALRLAASDEERAMALALLGRSRLGREERQAGHTALRESLKLDADGRFADDCRRILRETGG